MAGKKCGDRLKSVVEHTDEAYRHFHFYAVPKPGEKFESIDESRAAAKRAAEAGMVKGAQNDAYKTAMRDWQDDFYADVGMKNGLTRIGPGRRRLTRSEDRAEKKQAAALKLALAAATEVAETSKSAAHAVVANAHAQASEILERCDVAKAIADEVERRAEKVLADEKT